MLAGRLGPSQFVVRLMEIPVIVLGSNEAERGVATIEHLPFLLTGPFPEIHPPFPGLQFAGIMALMCDQIFGLILKMRSCLFV
ncbi:MAG: hypothetical protein CMO61_06490 [Verrucomicrobiales bacterium]|nr:hypothetical protein [Verrucomicrobiales bacterium]